MFYCTHEIISIIILSRLGNYSYVVILWNVGRYLRTTITPNGWDTHMTHQWPTHEQYNNFMFIIVPMMK